MTRNRSSIKDLSSACVDPEEEYYECASEIHPDPIPGSEILELCNRLSACGTWQVFSGIPLAVPVSIETSELGGDFIDDI